MKTVVYTCITGGYDSLIQPCVVLGACDFVCFTDDIRGLLASAGISGSPAVAGISGEGGAGETFVPSVDAGSFDFAYVAGSTGPVMGPHCGVWELREIPFTDTDPVRLVRRVKLSPHLLFPDYEVSVWMDANVGIRDVSFYDYLSRFQASTGLIAHMPHPLHDCVYEDMKHVLRIGKSPLGPVYRQYRHLRREGYPEHSGYYESNVIFRRHMETAVVALSEAWLAELSAYSLRDQFSLVYVYWKAGFTPAYIIDNHHSARNSKAFVFVAHPSEASSCLSLRKRIRNRFYRLLVRILM